MRQPDGRAKLRVVANDALEMVRCPETTTNVRRRCEP